MVPEHQILVSEQGQRRGCGAVLHGPRGFADYGLDSRLSTLFPARSGPAWCPALGMTPAGAPSQDESRHLAWVCGANLGWLLNPEGWMIPLVEVCPRPIPPSTPTLAASAPEPPPRGPMLQEARGRQRAAPRGAELSPRGRP